MTATRQMRRNNVKGGGAGGIGGAAAFLLEWETYLKFVLSIGFFISQRRSKCADTHTHTHTVCCVLKHFTDIITFPTLDPNLHC